MHDAKQPCTAALVQFLARVRNVVLLTAELDDHNYDKNRNCYYPDNEYQCIVFWTENLTLAVYAYDKNLKSMST